MFRANNNAFDISSGSNTWKLLVNSFFFLFEENILFANDVFVLPGVISVNLTLDPLSSIRKLCAILWIAVFWLLYIAESVGYRPAIDPIKKICPFLF